MVKHILLYFYNTITIIWSYDYYTPTILILGSKVEDSVMKDYIYSVAYTAQFN